jgi:hypothetical protein
LYVVWEIKGPGGNAHDFVELIGSIVVAAPANYTDIREPILCSFGDKGRNCQARKGIGRSPKQTGRPYIE